MASALEDALSSSAALGVKPGMERIRAAIAASGALEQESTVFAAPVPRMIHVAGTNGKGAVCAMLDSALRAAGFRTGRYTSPHLVSLNERFFLDGAPVGDAMLDAALADAGDVSRLTYFELLTLAAFCLYRRAGAEWLVLETGLGGRLDATNAVEKPELCVITRIGLDHCDWLGGTIGEIAAEKGGIIKAGVPVVLGRMPDAAREVLERIASGRGSPCVYAPDAVAETEIPELSLKGGFNRENAVTALAALKVLGIDRAAAEWGLASAVWPGRFQRVERDDRVFIVDGAHNPPAMRALADAVKAERFRVDAAVCGFCGDKDVAENLRILREVAGCGVATAIRNPRSLTAAATAAAMRAAGFAEVCEAASVAEALAGAPRSVLVCGSLFLAGEALEALGAMPHATGPFCDNERF
jgi:dihydrofolate synthase/folylpolyglutamate synthase